MDKNGEFQKVNVPFLFTVNAVVKYAFFQRVYLLFPALYMQNHDKIVLILNYYRRLSAPTKEILLRFKKRKRKKTLKEQCLYCLTTI